MTILSTPAYRALTAFSGSARITVTGTGAVCGQPLGSVLSITDQPQQVAVPVNAPLAASAAGRPVPVLPGSQQPSVSVTVVFGSGWRRRGWPARLARMHANRAAGWWRRR